MAASDQATFASENAVCIPVSFIDHSDTGAPPTNGNPPRCHKLPSTEPSVCMDNSALGAIESSPYYLCGTFELTTPADNLPDRDHGIARRALAALGLGNRVLPARMETNRARDAKGRFLVAVIALWAGGCSHVATGSASADASVPISPWPNVSLPFAEHVLDMNDAPVIVVDTHGITLDGEAAGDVGPIIATSRMQRMILLFESLKRKRDAWRVAHPDQIFSGECNLVIDASVRAVVVKSVFQTAAFAGYPNASFVVRRLPPESSRARSVVSR